MGDARTAENAPAAHAGAPAAATWAGLVALTGLAFAARLARLTQTAEPAGTDGYYYVVQVEDLVARGQLHVADGSWVLQALGGVHAAIGDPVLAVKVGAALLAAACVPAAWALGRAIGSDRAAWGLAIWALASPSLTHLAADFPKNLGIAAPLLLTLAIAFTRPATSAASTLPRLAAVAALALAAATAHRVGAAVVGLALLGVGLGLLVSAVSSPEARAGGGPRDRARVVAAGAVAGGVVFAALSLALPNLLHPADLERLQGQLRASPWPPPPVPWFALRTFAWPEIVELIATWPALLVGCIAWIRRPDVRLAALIVPLAVCLFPWWRADELDLGYRLSLVAPLLAAPLLALATKDLAPSGSARWWTIAAAAMAGALVAPTGWRPDDLPPYDRYRGLLARVPRPLPDLLVAHQGINFLYDHQTGAEAMAWAPEPELDPLGVGRIAWGIRDGEWLAYAPEPLPVRLDADYVYVREDVWTAFVAASADDGEIAERIADWRNPTRLRPASVRRDRR